MQFRNLIAALLFFLVNIFAVLAEDSTSTVTVYTEIEITSTVYVATVTMTGTPPKGNGGPMLFEAITTILPNVTDIPKPNSGDDDDKGAAARSVTPVGFAGLVAGAAVLIVGML